MATNTARLQLRKPAGGDTVNVTTDLSDNYDKIDNFAIDFYDRGGWQFIDSGEGITEGFNIDLTKAGAFPAGTFRLIKIYMEPTLDTGNDFIICTVNNLTGASDYNRGWWGESFDGVTASRKASSTSNRMVMGYASALSGSSLEAIFHKTHVASDLPMRSEAVRGASSGFDGNREWMKCGNNMNTNTLINSIQVSTTSGTTAIASCHWQALGFYIP